MRSSLHFSVKNKVFVDIFSFHYILHCSAFICFISNLSFISLLLMFLLLYHVGGIINEKGVLFGIFTPLLYHYSIDNKHYYDTCVASRNKFYPNFGNSDLYDVSFLFFFRSNNIFHDHFLPQTILGVPCYFCDIISSFYFCWILFRLRDEIWYD